MKKIFKLSIFIIFVSIVVLCTSCGKIEEDSLLTKKDPKLGLTVENVNLESWKNYEKYEVSEVIIKKEIENSMKEDGFYHLSYYKYDLKEFDEIKANNEFSLIELENNFSLKYPKFSLPKYEFYIGQKILRLDKYKYGGDQYLFFDNKEDGELIQYGFAESGVDYDSAAYILFSYVKGSPFYFDWKKVDGEYKLNKIIFHDYLSKENGNIYNYKIELILTIIE